MKQVLITMAIAMPLFAIESQTIHSSLLAYYENKTYTNSKQKIDGRVYGVGGDIHYTNNEIRFAYEDGAATTKKPPLSKDLSNQKLFLRYGYRYNNFLRVHLHYLSVLDDNIAITSGGKGYGLGIAYIPNTQLHYHLTQYLVKYDDFQTYQSDFGIDFKQKTQVITYKLSAIGKYIRLKDIYPNNFTHNAKKEYFTAGLKIHTHYKSYHFGAGAYFGKRVFAVMNEGFKLQHHAMEFSKTYALGIGKTIKKFVLRAQYIYNEATELPINNPNVKIQNIRLLLNYKL